MSDNREHRIRERAYHIWEREGRKGRPEDHWLEAEAAELKRQPEQMSTQGGEQTSPPKHKTARGKASPSKTPKPRADEGEASETKPAAGRAKRLTAEEKSSASRSRRTPS